MIRSELEHTLASNAAELRRMHVARLHAFGSLVRKEAGPESDIDLLVEFDEAVDLFDFVAVQDRLSELLGSKVDLVTRPALHPRLRERILSEAVQVFGAAFNAAA
ncbi:MAG: nucleotidyltransferase family protein [Alphaproteobacteria bacterium]|jgi:predicted nucleotidyltransferase|nr:nucleotidyltransferase family protein [Alphaproteobacteria bacterium]